MCPRKALRFNLKNKNYTKKGKGEPPFNLLSSIESNTGSTKVLKIKVLCPDISTCTMNVLCFLDISTKKEPTHQCESALLLINSIFRLAHYFSKIILRVST